MARRTNDPTPSSPASGLSLGEKIAAGVAAGVAVVGVVVAGVALSSRSSRKKKAKTLTLDQRADIARAQIVALGYGATIGTPASGGAPGAVSRPSTTAADIAAGVDTTAKAVDTGVKVAGTISDLAGAL